MNEKQKKPIGKFFVRNDLPFSYDDESNRVLSHDPDVKIIEAINGGMGVAFDINIFLQIIDKYYSVSVTYEPQRNGKGEIILQNPGVNHFPTGIVWDNVRLQPGFYSHLLNRHYDYAFQTSIPDEQRDFVVSALLGIFSQQKKSANFPARTCAINFSKKLGLHPSNYEVIWNA